MASGKSTIQVAAYLKLSKRQFNQLLLSKNEDPLMQENLKAAIELGHTLHEAHFEEFYVDAMSGKVHGVKENLLKAYFQNKFKWADKTETQTIEDKISELSDAEIEERINNAKGINL